MDAKRRGYWPFVAIGAAVLVPLIACGACGMFGMFASIVSRKAKPPPEVVETPVPAVTPPVPALPPARLPPPAEASTAPPPEPPSSSVGSPVSLPPKSRSVFPPQAANKPTMAIMAVVPRLPIAEAYAEQVVGARRGRQDVAQSAGVRQISMPGPGTTTLPPGCAATGRTARRPRLPTPTPKQHGRAYVVARGRDHRRSPLLSSEPRPATDMHDGWRAPGAELVSGPNGGDVGAWTALHWSMPWCSASSAVLGAAWRWLRAERVHGSPLTLHRLDGRGLRGAVDGGAQQGQQAQPVQPH